MDGFDLESPPKDHKPLGDDTYPALNHRHDGTAAVHPGLRRGRGAASNASGRYEQAMRVAVDDGWGTLDEEPPPLQTTVLKDTSRSIIAYNRSPDVPFDRSINPYRGCEHGCVYCFARPSHAWLGLSPGLDFETKLFAKPDAAKLLDKALRAPSYRCRVLGMGTNTDPYQPVERKHRITRAVLEVLARFNHPVGLVTKAALITRDVDILAPMAARQLARVAVSVTTLDHRLARKMEPRASTPRKRLATITQLAAIGIPTTVLVAPLIPGLNDHELDAILESARDAGATRAGYVMLRLPLEVKDLFREWLAEQVPDRAARVMSLVRAVRGGRDYDPQWGSRMRGAGPVADVVRDRFRLACRRLGLNARSHDLDTTQFRPPLTSATASGTQLALF